MKGLILKDFIFVYRLYLKVILMLFGFYLILAAFSSGEGMDPYTIASALTALFSIFPLATFSLDKASHWDRYALSGPVDRRMLVLSKYIFSWASILTGGLFSLLYVAAVSLIQGFPSAAELSEILRFIFWFALGGLLFNGFMLPCVYRFGPERARLFTFALIGIPFLAGLIAKGLHLPAPPEGVVGLFSALLPLLTLLFTYLSYRLSLHIYRKQEID